jgi:hypothetical protein
VKKLWQLILGVGVLAGISLIWFLVSEPVISPRTFERIELGMSREKVENGIGLPPGAYGRTASGITVVLRKRIGIEMPSFFKTYRWSGDSFRIEVTFDDAEKVAWAVLWEALDVRAFHRHFDWFVSKFQR